jgi:Uncharacterised nucleotidyltransferase/Transglutaminase-like superfamily
MTATTQLQNYLAGIDATLPPTEILKRYRLDGFAYAQLEATDKDRPALRPAYLEYRVRHAFVASVLCGLLNSWSEAGIDALLFKGFALAEFEYEDPAARFYGDVDVIIKERDEIRACEIAETQGWSVLWRRRDSPYRSSPELAAIYDSSRRVRIDLHAEILSPRSAFISTWLAGDRARITGALWQGAVAHHWHGARMFMPQPVDALLIALLLNRRFGERWMLKPQDILDARLLVKHHGLTLEAVEERATQLGCLNTFRLLKQRINPWLPHFDLTRPSRGDRFRWDLMTATELGHQPLDQVWWRLEQVPAFFLATARALPVAYRALRHARQAIPIPDLIDAFEPRTRRSVPLTPREREVTVIGARWATALFRLPRLCVPRALTVYYLLRAGGIDAQFVSGVRQTSSGIDGHAWVEFEGVPVDPLDSNVLVEGFVAQLRYPSA